MEDKKEKAKSGLLMKIKSMLSYSPARDRIKKAKPEPLFDKSKLDKFRTIKKIRDKE